MCKWVSEFPRLQCDFLAPHPSPLTRTSHPHPPPPLLLNAGERPSSNPSNGHYFNGTQQRVCFVRSMPPEADCFAPPRFTPPLPSLLWPCMSHAWRRRYCTFPCISAQSKKWLVTSSLTRPRKILRKYLLNFLEWNSTEI